MVVELLLVTCQAPPNMDARTKRCHEAYRTKKGQVCNNENLNAGWQSCADDGCLTLDMECVESDRDCPMDLKVESREKICYLACCNSTMFLSSAVPL
ncbi:hypothetical protein PVAP13_8KG295700 [Panicum virgatum]|uniref:Uncharacterized protein n=1 Tax=Panicum virgatum TaxID=38727 RepID=A0A8T0PIF1_PANVG|nr:hypothetical protein PVAP13_8KG295700 [Panicum virgatum]